MIIGFSGKMGAGKNYIAEKILPSVLQTNIYYMAFGDQIKVELGCRNVELSHNQLFNDKPNHVRNLLQTYGTENGRDAHGENVWIKALSLWMDIYKSKNRRNDVVFVITDVRFRNEAKWIQDNNGILIRINAPNRNLLKLNESSAGAGAGEHSSETELDNYEFQHIVHNEIDDNPEKQLKHLFTNSLNFMHAVKQQSCAVKQNELLVEILGGRPDAGTPQPTDHFA